MKVHDKLDAIIRDLSDLRSEVSGRLATVETKQDDAIARICEVETDQKDVKRAMNFLSVSGRLLAVGAAVGAILKVFLGV